MQLLLKKIPKAQKDSEVISAFFLLLGSACAKAAHKMLLNFTPGFAQIYSKICSDR